MFTAAQAAQKTAFSQNPALIAFTAAQAAQKSRTLFPNSSCTFTAAQAAQKLGHSRSTWGK